MRRCGWRRAPAVLVAVCPRAVLLARELHRLSLAYAPGAGGPAGNGGAGTASGVSSVNLLSSAPPRECAIDRAMPCRAGGAKEPLRRLSRFCPTRRKTLTFMCRSRMHGILHDNTHTHPGRRDGSSNISSGKSCTIGATGLLATLPFTSPSATTRMPGTAPRGPTPWSTRRSSTVRPFAPRHPERALYSCVCVCVCVRICLSRRGG